MTTIYEAIQHVLKRAGPMENRDRTRDELVDAISDALMGGGLRNEDGQPMGRAEMRTKIRRLESALETERSMRPQWAQGFTSDSMAAQSTSTALHALWDMLQVTNQTQATAKLRIILTGKSD